jgi:DNA-directed RNA polymerase subunit F
MRRIPAALLVLGIAGFGATSQAQTPELSSKVSAPPLPAVTFTQDFPESTPSHYSLRVAKDGTARYESMGKLTPEAEGDPFSYSFTISEASVARIFELAASAKYFDRDVDYKKGRQANTGKKTLRYEDPTHRQQTEYNYSTYSEIQQLTKSFQSIALTMEFARHLQYFRRYQPLALEEDLKRMEEMAKDNDLKELQAIAPILQDIAEDKAVLNVARVRAQRLLALGAKSSSQ